VIPPPPPTFIAAFARLENRPYLSRYGFATQLRLARRRPTDFVEIAPAVANTARLTPADVPDRVTAYASPAPAPTFAAVFAVARTFGFRAACRILPGVPSRLPDDLLTDAEMFGRRP
jgi:hypothetical protein